LQLQYRPGDIVVPDQLYDRTRQRTSSFFDDAAAGTGGLVVHVSVADPFCPYLIRVCAEAVEVTGHKAHRGGVFVTIEGPRFSTKAESEVFQQLGFAIIGMTAIPEAFLAREAGMSYATMAHVTDYDVWHETEAPVTVEAIIQQFNANVQVAKASVVNAILTLRDAPPSPYADALRGAIITNLSVVPAEVLSRLDLLIGKYL
jgi:5'-methylthioadenosine phosphorylase